MKLVTAEQMRRIDREVIGNLGVPGPQLMENAGRGIATAIMNGVLGDSLDPAVSIFCGPGNNGGDGFVVGRYLQEDEVQVTIYFLGPPEKLSDDAKLNFERAAGAGIEVFELASPQDFPESMDSDWIVDAIFGTGFSGSPRGLAAELIQHINRMPQPVISVDMPSGLNADNGRAEGVVIGARYSFPLALPKFGLYVSPGRELAGQVEVIPIGIPDDVLEQFGLTVELVTHDMIEGFLPRRKPDGHKGDFGKVLLVAGSTGLTGAAGLAALSALRAGCGLAKIACPSTVLPILANLAMEATSYPLPDVAKKGAVALRALGEIRVLTQEHDAVIVGPGLGRHRETFELVRRYISKLGKPVIVDADGLNALADATEVIKESEAPMVLTPHPGEFRRLTGEAVPSDIHERLATAVRFAKEHRSVLVLKGSPTVVAEPGGHSYVNPTGNHGMASGGAGDVLSGMIGTFLAQGLSPCEAAVCGVYIHGLAGDLAAAALTPDSMVASDIMRSLPEAFRYLRGEGLP